MLRNPVGMLDSFGEVEGVINLQATPHKMLCLDMINGLIV